MARSVTSVREVADGAPRADRAFADALVGLMVESERPGGEALLARLRDIARQLPVILVAAGPDAHFESAYGGGLAALGLNDDDLVGLPVELFGDEARRLYDRVLGGDTATVEVEGETDGEPWAITLTLTPRTEGEGMVGIAFDRTRELVASRLFARREHTHEQVVGALDEGILVVDGAGTILTINQRAVDVLGIGGRTPHVVGRNSDELGWRIVDEDLAVVPLGDRLSQRALADGRPRKGEVVGIDHGPAGIIWLRLNVIPIELDDTPAVVISFVDITGERVAAAALAESEQRFERLTDNAPIGIFTMSANGTLTYANAQIERQTGLTFEQLSVGGYRGAIHPEDRERMDAVFEAYGRTLGEYLEEHRLLRSDGTTVWVRVRLAPIELDGELQGFVGTVMDITDLVVANAQLIEREERMRAIIETAAEGIITTDADRVILEFNAAAERILGYDSEEVVGQLRFDDLLAQPQREHLVRTFEEYLAGAPSQFIGQPASEVSYVRKDGTVVPVELAVTEVTTGSGRLFTGVLHDVSERKAFERELEHLSTHDPLTGLPNRALLLAELETALHRAARHHTNVGVFFVQLARMKTVTDSLGHRAGDQLVVEAARRLEKLSESCTVTRFSSGDFVVFYEDLEDINDAADLAAHMIDVLDKPYMVSSEEAFIKAYVGVTYSFEGAGTAESLISNADVAMNRARASSGVGFEVFDSDMRASVDARRKLEIALRHGIERNEFELYYQPIVSIDTRVTHGFEALIRWNHPERGVVSPYEFVPLAEDSGLIVPLGEWILHEACEQLATWQQEHPDRGLRVAVNLSARQLAQPELPAIVAGALLASGADPKGLELEITETVLLDDVDAAGRRLTALKKLGLNLSMDDFGTGYSSLTYLCQFPIDTVKVDRSFVAELGTGSRDASIAPLVIRLAQTLGMAVVAEGVETKEQLAALADLECTYAQGYYFSKPKPKKEAERMIQRGSRRSERF